MNDILLPGDIVINTRSLVGDKGTSLPPGSTFKVVATDGFSAVLIRKEEQNKFINAEMFLAQSRILKIIGDGGDIEVVEGINNEIIRSKQNRKHKM